MTLGGQIGKNTRQLMKSYCKLQYISLEVIVSLFQSDNISMFNAVFDIIVTYKNHL